MEGEIERVWLVDPINTTKKKTVYAWFYRIKREKSWAELKHKDLRKLDLFQLIMGIYYRLTW